MEGCIQKLCTPRRYTHRGENGESNALLWLRNMDFRKNAIMPFSKSNAIVGPNFESRNLILLTRNCTTCDLWGQGKKAITEFN